jgi:transcriptional regulator with XRE-family HTH domain
MAQYRAKDRFPLHVISPMSFIQALPHAEFNTRYKIPHEEFLIWKYPGMKGISMRKLLAQKVRLWMGRVPAVDTQAKLAVKAGMSASSIHRILHEDTEPELDTAYKLSRAFGISLSEFLSEQPGQGTLLDSNRYAALPESEKEKIRAFAEFVLASQSASHDSDTTLSMSIAPSTEQAQLVEHVAQRNQTSESLRIHADSSQNRKKRRKLQGH